MEKKSKLKLKKIAGDFDFENLRTNENGKFITDKTKIDTDEKQKIVTFTNSYPDGEIQKIVVKLKEKKWKK